MYKEYIEKVQKQIEKLTPENIDKQMLTVQKRLDEIQSKNIENTIKIKEYNFKERLYSLTSKGHKEEIIKLEKSIEKMTQKLTKLKSKKITPSDIEKLKIQHNKQIISLTTNIEDTIKQYETTIENIKSIDIKEELKDKQEELAFYEKLQKEFEEDIK